MNSYYYKYKYNFDAAKIKRDIISDNISITRDILEVYCKRNPLFSTYCKMRMDTLQYEYERADEENQIALHINNLDRDIIHSENLETMERSYYEIYKDYIFFA